MSYYPTGTIVKHKERQELGYGIVVQSLFAPVAENFLDAEQIIVVLWHGDEENDIVEVPQIHTGEELKILNTMIGWA